MTANGKLENKFVNALAHMAAGLVAKYPQISEMRFDTYTDKNGGAHQSISDHPFIILAAKNSNKLRNLRESLIEEGVQFVDFTNTMTVGTYIEQKERTAQTPEAELEYYGVCMFGKATTLAKLTKKFSLWQ